MAVPDKVAGDKYKQAMLGIAEQLKWQPGPRVMHADDQAVGQMYMEQYFHPQRSEDDGPHARASRHRDGHARSDRCRERPLWWWCDALFMAPPVYADMARATGDKKYLDFMDHEWDITTALLYDRSKHLYFRDATFLDKHEKNGEPLFWSRGNGWVMGGIVRVLKELPADSPLRPKYVACSRRWQRRCSPFRARTDCGVPACSMPTRIRCRRSPAAPSSPMRWPTA